MRGDLDVFRCAECGSLGNFFMAGVSLLQANLYVRGLIASGKSLWQGSHCFRQCLCVRGLIASGVAEAYKLYVDSERIRFHWRCLCALFDFSILGVSARE